MNVELIKADSTDSLYVAAQVCRSTDNASTALKHSIEAGHESLLEHVSVTYKITGISRACSHQLVRHRIASYSQQSQRHVIVNAEEVWFVKPDNVEEEMFNDIMDYLIDNYMFMIESGVPEEDARYVLPNACKTDLVMTINLRSLINLFKHRICNRTQKEFRELATVMYLKIKHLYPIIFNQYTFPACDECKEPCGECNGCISEI